MSYLLVYRPGNFEFFLNGQKCVLTLLDYHLLGPIKVLVAVFGHQPFQKSQILKKMKKAK